MFLSGRGRLEEGFHEENYFFTQEIFKNTQWIEGHSSALPPVYTRSRYDQPLTNLPYYYSLKTINKILDCPTT